MVAALCFAGTQSISGQFRYAGWAVMCHCFAQSQMTIPGRYGTKVVRYLEDGDTVEDAELYNGALIQPVLDDGEYGILLCFVSLWLLFPFCY